MAGFASKVQNAQIARRGFFLALGVWNTITTRAPFGTNVFERDWDLLILLDTCRVDALQEISDEYDYLNNVGKLRSVGSTSTEWMAQTFREEYAEEIAQTVYVSANGNSERILEEGKYPPPEHNSRTAFPANSIVSGDDLLLHDQPWMWADDDTSGALRPEFITDRAIQLGRDLDPERLILHYSQPHSPFVARAINEDREPKRYEREPFDALRDGTAFGTIWDAYLDELRSVLDNLEVLLENVDADKVVISADHGEAFGEWGMYAHFPGIPHPQVRWVPWAKTTASDKGSRQPDINPNHESAKSRTVDEHLEALGYK